MHLRILPDHQKLFSNKIFWKSVVVKNVCWCIFAYFQTTRKMFWKKIFFTVWNGLKRFLMHLRILPDHQKLFFKKDIFECLKWLKTCVDAFSHTSRPPEKCSEKRYFWPSGVVKNVFWCISAYFQTTKNFFSKKIILNVWSG